MSLIRVDNFGPSAGGTTYSARGIAKAWVNFNGTGTVAVRDSENVSSLTDISTGRYAANLSSSMTDANYSIQVCSSATVDNNGYDMTHNPTMTSSFCPARHFESGGTATDTDLVTVAIHGDLA